MDLLSIIYLGTIVAWLLYMRLYDFMCLETTTWELWDQTQVFSGQIQPLEQPLDIPDLNRAVHF